MNEHEDNYREMLDAVYGEVDICGMTYTPSLALERVDPIAYRVGMSDYECGECEECKETTDDADE